MEVYFPGKSLDSRDIKSNESFTGPSKLIEHSSLEFSVSDLETSLIEFLHIEDTKTSDACFNQNAVHNLRGGNDKELMKNSGIAASEKCYRKSATFPSPGYSKSSDDGLLDVNENQEGENEITVEVSAASYDVITDQPISRSISFPTPRKLVSAMKGGRDRQGILPSKLSVTWAPDVYDPIPNAASHFPSNKNQRHRSDGRKHGKGSHRSFAKPSRASKGKDKKKQVRKNSCSYSKVKPLNDNVRMIGFSKFKPFQDDSEVIAFSKSLMPIADFNVENPDPFCGSSFLKRSVSKLLFPVAEAT